MEICLKNTENGVEDFKKPDLVTLGYMVGKLVKLAHFSHSLHILQNSDPLHNQY